MYIGMSVDGFEGRLPKVKSKSRPRMDIELKKKTRRGERNLPRLCMNVAGKRVAARARVSLDVGDLRGSGYINSALQSNVKHNNPD
jgi:hypothetical protein